ncbi:cell wall hydrolase [Bartonella sp. M0177]|uniref:cell wall hydrolase n=1 Tax=Bartonella sp. M0177 TaxID=2750940 RepID=UPI0035A862ED
MFEVSFIPSLRRHGNKGKRSDVLRTASSYYMPEGRFYEAPVILKQEKRKSRVLPLFLGASLSVLTASSIHKLDMDGGFLSQKSVLAHDSRNKSINASSLVEPMKASGIELSGNVRPDSLSQKKIDLASDSDVSNPDVKREKSKALEHRDEENYNISYSDEPEWLLNSGRITPFSESFQQVGSFEMAQRTAPANGASQNDLEKKDNADQKSGEKIALVIPQKKPVAKLPVPKILKNLVTNDNPDVMALAYAPANAKVDTSAFDSVLTEKHSQIDRNGRFIPPIGRNDHAWAATPLPPEAFSAKEQKCLAEAVYFESRGESIKGQAAVAQVVLNRVRNPAYPNTICGVVYQNTNWINHCQFSFACDGRKHRVTEMAQWTVAQQVARAVSAGQIWFPEVGSATHYHAVYVRPRWARTMIKVDKIGLHIFYRTRYGGWI